MKGGCESNGCVWPEGLSFFEGISEGGTHVVLLS